MNPSTDLINGASHYEKNKIKTPRNTLNLTSIFLFIPQRFIFWTRICNCIPYPQLFAPSRGIITIEDPIKAYIEKQRLHDRCKETAVGFFKAEGEFHA
jgi:hypothetical protein